jgi:hypothetical protein
MDIFSFYPIVKDFIQHVFRYYKWKEEDKLVDYKYFEKVAENLKKEGYRVYCSEPEKVEARKLDGWKIHYEEDKTKHIRYRLINNDRAIFIKKLER